MVERRRDPEDRRRYDLALTEAGERKISEAEVLAARIQDAVLAPLGDDERRLLHEMLASILQNLDEGGRFREASR